MALTLSSSGTGGVFTLRGGSFGGRFQASVTPPGLLLDQYTGAAAAYSLRKLRTAYSGAAIRVRRSSDSTETDIGFVNNQLDTATLLTFCGANNGFVTTWYDQSGNTRNTAQATTANQPQIVTSGVVNLRGTKPTITFNGASSQNLTRPDTGLPGAVEATYITLTTCNNSFFSTNYNAFFNYGQASNGASVSLFYGATISGTGQDLGVSQYGDSFGYVSRMSNQYNLQFVKKPASTGLWEQWINNTLYASKTMSTGTSVIGSTFMLGGGFGAGYYLNGTMQEVIVYQTNQTTNRTAIETNINSFYSIY